MNRLINGLNNRLTNRLMNKLLLDQSHGRTITVKTHLKDGDLEFSRHIYLVQGIYKCAGICL